ncbi:SGNH/GDSL hydrolase family protein [Jatrophihabitans endophyticus]|uniref:SGNH/GDSL hydrolase family protein n=1 Tax=Jatrophihabitans endophyticus TaxID=1206085 RepID=UPI0019E8085C|nr:SGNH/GDSL hydrolase family protein [Jatrophihabitans endophyticus]MBE7190468.1 SGNH/GDSL hydrolase family protein [Jatrophihabitans endophyticus]
MNSSSSAPGPRVVVAGDSWVRGLTRTGSGSIARLFPAACSASEVLDVSLISRTVPETVAGHLDEIKRFRPDLALLGIGGADSLVFPALWFQKLIDRFAPPEWAGVTGLMPPAVLPRDRRQRLRKKVEIFGKTVIKQFMINAFGARRRVPLAEVESAARELLDTLARSGTVVVVLGCSDVDHLTFPKSTKNIRATNAMLERLCESHPDALYLDTRTTVDKWDDYLEDHVHLTREGSRKVCDAVVASMVGAGGRWAAQFAPREVSPTAAAG